MPSKRYFNFLANLGIFIPVPRQGFGSQKNMSLDEAKPHRRSSMWPIANIFCLINRRIFGTHQLAFGTDRIRSRIVDHTRLISLDSGCRSRNTPATQTMAEPPAATKNAGTY